MWSHPGWIAGLMKGETLHLRVLESGHIGTSSGWQKERSQLTNAVRPREQRGKLTFVAVQVWPDGVP